MSLIGAWQDLPSSGDRIKWLCWSQGSGSALTDFAKSCHHTAQRSVGMLTVVGRSLKRTMDGQSLPVGQKFETENPLART